MIETIGIEVQKTEQSRIKEIDFHNIDFGKVYSDHMFVADFEDGEWKNFQILPYADLSLSPANTVLHYSQSVFEGLKAYKNDKGDALIFRPFDNFRRLNKSAARMCIPELPEEIYAEGLTELIKLDKAWVPDVPGTSLYIRPFIFGADNYIGIRPSTTYKFIIFTCPVGAYYSQPVRVKIETKFSRAFEGGTGAAKTGGNYAASLYPAKLAQEQGYHQLIWTDGKSHEYIEESGTMNVMFVINNTLITPPTGDTILHGITRESVLTLARDWGYQVEERKISVREVIDAAQNGTLQEAFGAGTAATIAQIATIGHDGQDYDLPPVEGRELSNKVLKALDEIKTGKREDKFNWIYTV
ncbi:branched-chain amino acid aminotransferase [Fulvivirgaceae bacterium BMA10]|uniref:branched-chain-amino-acid transaminase n=1 Tax=Splendidivirga corallicola TaxID=3051826 RepID=A0ABT8KQK0_9BACT|nr:branched-chain amino acid aminotransferase [Fulvivirgaceae bacterium BMA10]